MTLLEFITDLQSQGFTDKEVFDKAQEFKKNNAAEEVVEENEVVEETEAVEETVEEVEEGNSNDSPPADADVDQTVVASEETEATELISEDGSLESEETTVQETVNPQDVVVNAPAGSEERKQQYIAKRWQFDATIPGFKKQEKEIESTLQDYDYYAKFGDELMEVSIGDLERAGWDMNALINPESGSKVKYSDKSGGQTVKVSKAKYFTLNRDNNPEVAETLEFSRTGAAAKVDTEGIRNTAAETYFGLSGIEDSNRGGLSEKYGENYKADYKKLSSSEAKALGLDTDMRGGKTDPKLISQAYLYDDYLKAKLGDRYAEYVKYQENPDEFKFPKKVTDYAAKAEEEKQRNNNNNNNST